MPTARDIMHRTPVTVTPATPVRQLAELLAETRYEGAPVVDEEGLLLGVVTESDIIFQKKNVHLPTFITLFDAVFPIGGEDQDEIRKILGSTVGEIMSTDLVTIEPEASLEEIATLMTDVHKSVLPVVENGKLIGIVDKHDLVVAIVKEK
ncbi:MAG: CBS domain-containing protein [Nitrospinae bacterium]|nr:CBS domain-containing protein [Nitrospinota bacterium]